ncbi:MAG: WD40/YVTN/BNR-like repeat-containing protein [Sphingobacterium sp.]
MKRIIYGILTIGLFQIAVAQEFEPLTEQTDVSFRGLDTHKKKVVWISGTKGTIGRSVDAGKTWSWVSPTGYQDYDFRDIEAFGANHAVVVSAGSPAVVLHTRDAGDTWTEVYRNDDPDIFLDGMDFQGRVGYILGDPIDGTFQLLKSTNKGRDWQDVSAAIHLFSEPGEVAFAASGTSIQVIGQWVYIGSGGKYSSVLKRNEKENRLDVVDVPIWSGTQSTGIFSIDFLDARRGVVVGGDYKKDQDNRNNIWLTSNAGLSWSQPDIPVSGYRSCVKYIDQNTLVATGTSGTDISRDGGQTWNLISPDSFNVVAVSSDGKHIYLAGSDGNVVKLHLLDSK